MSKQRRIRAIGIGAILALAVGLGFAMFSSRTPSFPPLPNPNGYDDLLAAANMLIGVDELGNADIGHDRLTALISTNAAALRRLRLGLSRPCAVPMASAITNTNFFMSDLSALRHVGILLAAEGRLAETEGRSADAIRSHLDAIRFGEKVSRGGLLLHRLSGIAAESWSVNSLAKLLPSLTAEQARSLVRKLEEIDQDTVKWEDIMEIERRYDRVREDHMGYLIYLVEHWMFRRNRRASKDRNDFESARVRLLSVEVALRCYRLEQGAPPATLEELMPANMARIPIDPFSTQALRYRPQGANWLLYSIGPDRLDDGGKPLRKVTRNSYLDTQRLGDVFYDSAW